MTIRAKATPWRKKAAVSTQFFDVEIRTGWERKPGEDIVRLNVWNPAEQKGVEMKLDADGAKLLMKEMHDRLFELYVRNEIDKANGDK